MKLFGRQRIHSWFSCYGDSEHVTDARVADCHHPFLYLTKPSVRKFNQKEIDIMATSTMIGQGGFSTVYLGYLPDSSSATALKVHYSSERLARAFCQELDILFRVNHPHIVRLIGYCNDSEQGVLVFEHIANGTLYENLHKSTAVLPWSRRVSVALQLAMALDYLHKRCDLQIIHGDIKASNILLDGTDNIKLCDFGSAQMGVQSKVAKSPNRIMGSPGYIDPHYVRTGMISKESDVYSYGVVLLELITGLAAFCSEKGQLLTTVVRQKLQGKEGRGMGELVVDPRLAGGYDVDEALVMTEIALLCVNTEQPSLRPSMAEILRIMRKRMPRLSI